VRFKSPATSAQVRETAPAVYCELQHPNLMPGYEFVRSGTVLNAFLDSGYGVSRVQQVDSKDRYLQHTAKHIICLRPLDHFKELTVGEYIPEVVFVAAHDGSSAMHLYGGLFRVICANGMITGDKWLNYRIPHRNGAEQAALTAASAIMEEMPKLSNRVMDMQERVLTDTEQSEFAKRAIALRWEEKTPFLPELLLIQRRVEDAGANLWRVLNRIQENLMKGGVSYVGPKGRNTTSKPLERITADVQVNRGLWNLAEEFLA